MSVESAEVSSDCGISGQVSGHVSSQVSGQVRGQVSSRSSADDSDVRAGLVASCTALLRRGELLRAGLWFPAAPAHGTGSGQRRGPVSATVKQPDYGQRPETMRKTAD